MSQSIVQYSRLVAFYSPTPTAVNAGVDFGVYKDTAWRDT